MVLATFHPSTIMLRLFCHIGQVQVKDGHLIGQCPNTSRQPWKPGGFLQLGVVGEIYFSFIKANSGKPVAEIPLCRLRLKANVRPARIFDKRNI